VPGPICTKKVGTRWNAVARGPARDAGNQEMPISLALARGGTRGTRYSQSFHSHWSRRKMGICIKQLNNAFSEHPCAFAAHDAAFVR
jgi:hypothetical protein